MSEASRVLRVTKYNPSLRDKRGRYRADDWTSVSDIGRSFGGVLLTQEHYLTVEQAYIQSAAHFFDVCDATLRIYQFENPLNLRNLVGMDELLFGLDWLDRDVLSNLEAGRQLLQSEYCSLVALVLREIIWASFEGKIDSRAQFGYDYYMYFKGSPSALDHSFIARVTSLGLFVESLESLP
jgi:hypothetical protein